ncbi:non-ribosomal peptide synthetase [Dactylosporangium sp. NPDC051485]|uniref:non-ribosomal peptide synthetase n=1 Tax=Dactylosporangium sp. NPDC051485 TaxID=3154846 RepID=UPI0034303989
MSGRLWSLLETAAHTHPDAVAVRDTDPARTLTYRALFDAAAAQSAALAAAGVTAGDVVAVTMRRSPREIVAVLAVLRLGAAFTGLDPQTPPLLAAETLERSGVGVVLGDAGRLAAFTDAVRGRLVIPAVVPGPDPIAAAPPPAEPDDSAAAYVICTSGAAGPVEAIPVSRGTLVRLAALAHPAAARRVARIGGLAEPFTAAEIFAALLAGGVVEVLPATAGTPDALAAIIEQRGITALWLAPGVFRQTAEFQPAALRGAVQVFTGGVPIAAEVVRRLLREAPQLCVTTVYGLDEPAAELTVSHLHDVAEVTDPRPAEPEQANQEHHRSRVVVQDVIVDTEHVADVLRRHPLVRAAAVVSAPGDRLLAGVVLADGDDPHDIGAVRAFAAERLPAGAVPALWVALAEVPRTAGGPVDARRLVDLATATDPVRRLARHRDRSAAPTTSVPVAPSRAAGIEQIVRSIWQTVLGHADFDAEEEFFDVGGTSLHLLEIRALLRRRIAGVEVRIDDLYAHSTIASLTGHLAAATAKGSR